MPLSGTYSVKEIANWILDYADQVGVPVSNMALNKLVYFAYEHALTEYGRKLTEAKIEAWDHGPVFREVYSSFKQFGADPITDRAKKYNTRTDSVETVHPDLASDDEEIIIEAIASMIRLPAFILREISHDARGPWAKVWNHTSSSNPGMEITDDLILSSLPTSRLSR